MYPRSVPSARIAPLLLAVATGTITACSTDDQSVNTAGGMYIHAGNNQTGAPGQALADPLEVQVTGTDGRPYSGATVRWTVSSGDGQVDPASSTTDGLGKASTTLSLGASAGTVVVGAAVDGLTPVSFTATADAACATVTTLTLGTPVAATLADTDCRRANGSRAQQYRLTVDHPLSLRIMQSSSAFDTHLWLYDAAGGPVGFSDDIGATDRNSEMRVFLTPGQYMIAASGFSPTDLGAYTLSADLDSTAVTGCRLFFAWVMRGVQVQQDLSSTDCVFSDQAGNTYYADPFFIFLRQGTTLTVVQSSTDLNTYVELYQFIDGGFLYLGFNDDDGSGSTDSRFEYAVMETGFYLVVPSSAFNQEVGSYTLSIQ